MSWFGAAYGDGRSLMTQVFLQGYFAGHDLGDLTVLVEEVLTACGVRAIAFSFHRFPGNLRRCFPAFSSRCFTM